MYKHVIFSRYRSNTKSFICALYGLWGMGFLVGMLLAHSYFNTFGSDLRFLIQKETTPFLHFFISFLPVVVLLFSLRYRVLFICFPLFFTEALCRSFTGVLLFLEFGSGAWLIRFLLLFSSGCVSVLLWWLLLRNITDSGARLTKDFWFVSVILSAVSVLDIFAITPFLSQLF